MKMSEYSSHPESVYKPKHCALHSRKNTFESKSHVELCIGKYRS